LVRRDNIQNKIVSWESVMTDQSCKISIAMLRSLSGFECFGSGRNKYRSSRFEPNCFGDRRYHNRWLLWRGIFSSNFSCVGNSILFRFRDRLHWMLWCLYGEPSAARMGEYFT